MARTMTDPDRKPSAASKLKTLPEAKQAELYELLKTTPLHTAVVTLAKEWRLQTSTRALSVFFSWYRGQQRFSRLQGIAESMQERAKQANPALSEDALFAIGQEVFTQLAIDDEDSLSWLRAQSIAMKRRALDQDERRLKLLEAKAALADQAEAVERAPELSPEEKLARYKQIFGINN
jgi:hypothetical protein